MHHELDRTVKLFNRLLRGVVDELPRLAVIDMHARAFLHDRHGALSVRRVCRLVPRSMRKPLQPKISALIESKHPPTLFHLRDVVTTFEGWPPRLRHDFLASVTGERVRHAA